MLGLLAVDAPIDVSSIEPTQVITALVVVLVGWLASRYTRRAVTKLLVRVPGTTEPIRNTIGHIAGYLVLFLGFGIALSMLGAAIQPLLAVAIIVGVVLFLALRGIADNVAAGVLLQTRRPVAIGDEISVSGFEGTIIEMNSRAVVIDTNDGRQVHVPNADLLGSPLANHSEHGARRTDIEVRARVGPADAASALDDVLDAARHANGVRSDPPSVVFATGIESGRLTMLLRVWHETTESKAAVSSVIMALGELATRTGVEITAISPPVDAPLTPPSPI